MTMVQQTRGWRGWYTWNPAFKYWHSMDRKPLCTVLWPVIITEHEVSPFEQITTVQMDVEEGFHSIWASTEVEALNAFRKKFLDEWMQVDILRNDDQFFLRLDGPIAARARIKIQSPLFSLEVDRPFATPEAAERFVQKVVRKREIKKLRPEIWYEVVVL